jgi:cupin 2 domain-containing protein
MNALPESAFGNLFVGIDQDAAEERIDRLVSQRGIVIERIVSTGQVSPEGFWYDDPRDEWVLLVTGSAALQFEADGSVRRQLLPGDYVHIPAHSRHRVAWTDETVPTVWLTVYFGADANSA